MPAPVVMVSRCCPARPRGRTRGDTPNSFTRSSDLSTYVATGGGHRLRIVGVTTNATPPPDNGATRTPHTTPGDPRVPQPDADRPMRARDVVAFGREVGRVLSDGRIIGRAEPFAKVFASSRHVKRAVGAPRG